MATPLKSRFPGSRCGSSSQHLNSFSLEVEASLWGDAREEVDKVPHKRLSSRPSALFSLDGGPSRPVSCQDRVRRPGAELPKFSCAEVLRRGDDQDSPQGGAECRKCKPPKGRHGFAKRSGSGSLPPSRKNISTSARPEPWHSQPPDRAPSFGASSHDVSLRSSS